MTKNDYIEKITQNLEHLTKDELKDVSILTTAQLGVRSKFAERQQLEHEIENLTPQLQQQALPVVPECVAEFITKVKKADNNLTYAFNSKFDECPAKYWNKAIVWRLNNPDEFARAWLDGYTVEKPQLFYLKNKITGMYLSSDGEGLYEQHKNHGFKFTQEDINSLDTGSYEQIEVME